MEIILLQHSPLADVNKRPSYLEISATLPGTNVIFDERVIRSLEPQFNLIKENEKGEEFEEQFEQIKTYLRIRPYHKKSEDEDQLLEIKDDHTVIANCVAPGIGGGIRGKKMKRMEFKFTKVLDESCSQEMVFEQSIAPLLDRFDAGENCLIFSYGATNSGKTYTMRGSSTKYGVIPRTLYHIFDRYQDRIYKGSDVQPFRHESTRELQIDQQKTLLDKKKVLIMSAGDTNEMKSRLKIGMAPLPRTSDISSHCVPVRYIGASQPLDMENCSVVGNASIYGMWVSFVELYNEKCFDLMSFGRRSEVKIVSEKGGYAYFKDLTELPVFSEEEAFALYLAGYKKLQISATQANQTSSRSHSFFTIRVVELGKTSQSVYPIKVHRMTFCDLAGCERVTLTENTGGKLRESANINQSLLSLLKVIRMIRDKQSHDQTFLEKIPFRESKLTRIFQGYFSTSTHIAMIVNVNPIPKLADSSIQTLINSAIASNIVAFRPQQLSQAMVEHDFTASYMHCSLDLADVMEETEDEAEDVENQPPGPMVTTRRAQIGRTIMPVDLVTSPIQMKILKEQNRIISPTVNVGKWNDFKKPVHIEKENRPQVEIQRLLCDNQQFQDIIAHLNTEIMLRDKAIENLNGKLKTVESETREQMLKDVEIPLKTVRDLEQRNLERKLEWSDQRCSQLRSRLALIDKEAVATQTDLSFTSLRSVKTQTQKGATSFSNSV